MHVLKKFEIVYVWITILVTSLLALEVSEVIMPGAHACYYSYINPGQRPEVEYQVMEGTPMDISMVIRDPNHQVVFNEERKTVGRYEFQAQIQGEYQICFDNTYNRVAHKLVYIEILVDGRSRIDGFNDQDFDRTNLHHDESLESRISNATHILTYIKSQLDLSLHLITLRRISETRDKNILDVNLALVNRWSLIYLVILVTVSTIQIIMIRSLFDDQSKLRKLLKSKTAW